MKITNVSNAINGVFPPRLHLWATNCGNSEQALYRIKSRKGKDYSGTKLFGTKVQKKKQAHDKHPL